MNIVVFGLSITSAWGNGHAITYRGLIAELARLGHRVHFFERDCPWYASHRDLHRPEYCRVTLYGNLRDLCDHADEISDADCLILGSYVPDGAAVGEWLVRKARGVVAFYDIDTPVTLARLAGDRCEYLTRSLVRKFDLYLSFTGGPTLDRIQREFGAERAAPLYCSVNPAHYKPKDQPIRWDLGYLGTYTEDRQPTLDKLLVATSRHCTRKRFVVAGPQYPEHLEWPANVERIEHLAPADHVRFYSSQRFTLNVTRGDMILAGWSPSIRLFEAAACGTPIITDAWEGLEEFFTPGREILIAGTTAEAVGFLRDMPECQRREIATKARRRVLTEHTAAHRAMELEALIQAVSSPSIERRPRQREAIQL